MRKIALALNEYMHQNKSMPRSAKAEHLPVSISIKYNFNVSSTETQNNDFIKLMSTVSPDTNGDVIVQFLTSHKGKYVQTSNFHFVAETKWK